MILKTFFKNKAFYFMKCNSRYGHRSWTKDHYLKFGDIFQESIKRKIRSQRQCGLKILIILFSCQNIILFLTTLNIYGS